MVDELYKYRPFNDKVLEIISEGVIWISKQRDLNDPFEFYFDIKPDMPFEEVKKRKKDATINNYMEKQNHLISILKDSFETGGIFSLSESREISLLWSHYADYHRGFCIGYEVNKNNDLGNGKCMEVKYYNSPPSFTFHELWNAVETRDDNLAKKLFEIMVLSKDINWSYEREWRVLYQQSNDLIIPNFEISSITFGMKMPEWQQKIIIKILEGKNVTYFRAGRKLNSYDVEIIKL
jgi:hypothetical protein